MLVTENFSLPYAKNYTNLSASSVHSHKGLGMSGFILILPADQLITDINNVTSWSAMKPSFRAHVMDADVVSSYPTVTAECNVSKETTVTEVLHVGDMQRTEFVLENINAIYGGVNAYSYCVKMFNYPTIEELLAD